MIYQTVNLLMHLLHFAIIIFSLFGWTLASFRPWHLVLQAAILLSWLGYGIWRGEWGKCVVTVAHWHWKEVWSLRPATESYIDYWLRYRLNLGVEAKLSERWTFGIFALTTLLSILLVLHDRYLF